MTNKTAQLMAMDGLDGEDVVMDSNDLFFKETPSDEDLVVMDGEDEVLEVDVDQDGDTDVIFNLSRIPGADNQSDLAVPEIEVEEEPEVEVVDDDKWSWSLPTFTKWLTKMMDETDPEFPRHSGTDTAGLERIISYFSAIDKEISKAVRMDHRNQLPIRVIEKARDTLRKGIEACEERCEEIEAFKYPKKQKGKKKKADASNEMVKEATFTGKMVVQVPMFISGIARVLINGMVSGGHDIEDMYLKLDKKYKFSDRDKFELMQVLDDMGYPMRRDRGYLPDEEVDGTSSDNFDWNANYSG